MKTLAFTENFDQELYSSRNIAFAFQRNANKLKKINHGMSPQEISEIVSDNVIAAVKEQFKKTEKDFKAKEKLKATE